MTCLVQIIITTSKIIESYMDKLIDRYPYKKILYLNWYQAAIGHLLLFKYYVQKYSQNVYFLISEQGIMLKAVTLDYFKKVDDQLTKFFTARIEQLQISGSTNFYNNILEDIKEQTQKLKDSRDCPYINLIYSEKIRNSCLAMKRLGYIKPYQNWEYHEREKKGFCFLIVRPEHRWKQIANSIYALARKRESPSQKGSTEKSWQIEISFEKFVWFYLKQSFKNFKKSLEIKQNKQDKFLTIVVKNDIEQFSDLEKEIETLTFFYRPTKPILMNSESATGKIVVLSPLQIQKITQLVYHQFGLTALVKELRKKMTGFLIIGTSDSMGFYETEPTLSSQNRTINPLQYKQDLIKVQRKSVNSILKLGRRHQIVSFEGVNYVQVKLEKALHETQFQNILRLRLPCIPRFYYWYQPSQQNPSFISFLLREYYSQKFIDHFIKASPYSQAFLLNSLANIVWQLHQKSIFIGSGFANVTGVNLQKNSPSEGEEQESLENIDIGEIYIDGISNDFSESRIIVEPGPSGSKEEDIHRFGKILNILFMFLKDEKLRQELRSAEEDNSDFLGILIEIIQDYLESRN